MARELPEIARFRVKRRREKHIKKGLCSKCGRCPPRQGRRLCQYCHELMLVARKIADRRLREKVVAAYGGKCACCGESAYEFLTFDHVNNDGAAHRAKMGQRGGTLILRWAVKNNFPKSIQLLCWNCNAAKQFHGGCPHKRNYDADGVLLG